MEQEFEVLSILVSESDEETAAKVRETDEIVRVLEMQEALEQAERPHLILSASCSAVSGASCSR